MRNWRRAARVAALAACSTVLLLSTSAVAQDDDEDWEDEEEQEPLPPLPEPSADEQTPAPVPESRGKPREKLLEAGGIVGVATPVVSDNNVDYSPAPLFAGYARIPIWQWTALRLVYSRSNHPVEGVPATAGAEANKQPNLDILKLQARAEATWAVTPGLELYGGIGVAWGRLEADSVKNSAKDRLIGIRRGVYLEYSGVLGASYEVLPRWVSVGLDVSAAAYGDQSGAIFRDAHDTYAGQAVTVEGLPRMDASWAAGISAAILF